MRVGESSYTLWRSNETEKPNARSPRTLERADSRCSTAARSKHRIQNEEIPLCYITWNFEIVVDWLESFVIAIKADMSDPCSGNQTKDSLDHAETGTDG